MNKKDKVLGCLYGGIIGDGFGSNYEGKANPTLDYNLPWNITDDSQMTLATCEAIYNNVNIDPALIADNFKEWFVKKRITGIGGSTYKALTELSHGGHWALVGRKGEMAAGNGAAMRIAPLAFYLDYQDDNDRRLIRDICRITHHNEEAYVGALAVLIAIKSAWNNKWNENSKIFEIIIDNIPDSSVKDRLIEFNARASSSIEELAKQFGCSGYVVETVPLAIYAASKIKEYNFRAIIEKLIMIGGDTDTIASITGQIMGCFIGKEHLPIQMINKLPEDEFIQNITNKFVENVMRRCA